MGFHSPTSKPIILSSFKENWHIWLLIGIIAIGTLLRLYRFGDLAITGNEDYVANAVQGVLETWLPLYPSGALYPRSLPLTYLTALSVNLFGYDEFALRIPSTVFSILSILVGYLLAARLFGTRVAVLAALLLAFSDWEILLGRTARMYGMLSFFLLLSTLLLDKAVMEGGRVNKLLSLTSIVVTCFIHKLAIMLLPFSIFYFLFRRPRGKAAFYLLVSGIVIILAYAGNQKLENHFYSQAIKSEKALIASHAAKSTVNAQIQNDRTVGKHPTDIWNKILGSTTFRILSEKHFRIILEMPRHSPVWVLVLIVGFVIGLAVLGIKSISKSDSRLYGGATIAVIFPLCLQQAVLALFVVLAYVSFARVFEPGEYRRRSCTLLLICGFFSILWILLGTIFLGGMPLENFQISTMMLFSFPTSYLTLFPAQYPFLSICALGSATIAMNRYLENGRIDEIGYITLLFAGTILLLGFHPLALTRPYPRYVAFLNPYFLIMVAFAIDLAIRNLVRLQRQNMSAAKKVVIFMVAISGITLIVRETGYTSWYAINTVYGENKLPAATAGYVRSFYPDQKSPAMYVANNAGPDDIVIAMDALAFHVYFPRVNFQLRRSGGTDAERWLGGQTLFSKQELIDVLGHYSDRRIWIVLEAGMLMRYENDHEWASIMNLIVSRGGQPHHVGRDNLSSVYLIRGH